MAHFGTEQDKTALNEMQFEPFILTRKKENFSESKSSYQLAEISFSLSLICKNEKKTRNYNGFKLKGSITF